MAGRFVITVPAEHRCAPPHPWIPGVPPKLKFGRGTLWECECGQRWVIPLTFNGRGWEPMNRER